VALKSALPALGSPVSGADLDATVVAERVSKRYPRTRAVQFEPVSSVFSRFSPPDDGFVDLEDDELGDDEGDEAAPPAPAAPDETFWALRNVSFHVRPGESLGVLGRHDSGKTTLLRILAGASFPTEGRVLVRGPVSPLPTALAGILKGKGGTGLPDACALLGIERRLVESHLDEIEELARSAPAAPGSDGEPEQRRRIRLAFAATVVLPARVFLLDDLPRSDPAFTEGLLEYVQERVRSGSSLVIASRWRDVVERVCDQTFWLREGRITEAGRTV
jgi:ABC-type polysaccharide/polyol phosphate transport system ATPase subunit